MEFFVCSKEGTYEDQKIECISYFKDYIHENKETFIETFNHYKDGEIIPKENLEWLYPIIQKCIDKCRKFNSNFEHDWKLSYFIPEIKRIIKK